MAGRRPATEACTAPDCEVIGNRRGLCERHYRQWYRQYAHLRCDRDGCRQILREVGTNRTVGRRLSHGGRAVAYCREHEHHHLAITDEVRELNRVRFAQHVQRDGECWTWNGPATTAKTSYGRFIPEGGGHQHWYAHRVAYGLLVGGHKQDRVLDHLCGNSLCVNPAHLEPVKQGENLRRRKRTAFKPMSKNITPAVQQFADEFGLPLPANN